MSAIIIIMLLVTCAAVVTDAMFTLGLRWRFWAALIIALIATDVYLVARYW
jgi:hypothetical protein